MPRHILNILRELLRRFLFQRLPVFPPEKRLRFSAVNPGVLYRSRQPEITDLKKISEKYGIRTIAIVRGHKNKDECDFVLSSGGTIFFYPILKPHDLKDSMIEHFLHVAQQASNWPILVHCRGGKDRTGLFVLCYRIEVQGWSPQKAWEEMLYWGHGSIQPAWFKPCIENRYNVKLK